MRIDKHTKIFIPILLIILILFTILIIKMYPSNDFISGGKGTHWEHLEGKIKEIDLQNKSLIIINQNQETILDCSNDAISLDIFKVGDTIRYYFFPNAVGKNNGHVAVSKNNGHTIEVSEIKKLEN